MNGDKGDGPIVNAERKQMIVVGGPNGSGKTTFVNGVLRSRRHEYLGADNIAAQLRADSPESAAIQAGRIFVERIRERIESGGNLIVESTLAGKSLRRQIEQASADGYSTVLMFVFLDSPNACVARVRHRVSRGGHNVPEEDIRRRYGRSLRNFWEIYRYTVDQWTLYLNSSEDSIAIACGRGDNYVVFNEEAMALFLTQSKSELP